MNFLMKIPHDKMGHMIAGVLVFLLAIAFSATIFVAMLIVAIVAGLKEVYDKYHPNHTADIWDAVATVSLAGLVAITILWRYGYAG